jgi:NADP-dependent 3-hydroxy acid dehydrogenase YdfG
MIDTWFNNSEQGSRDETWALNPQVLAEQIAQLLDQPEHVIIDELVIHPAQQDY